MNQSTSIIEIKGIGEKTAALFQKLNIETVGDLLLHYPRTYVQFPVAKEVAEVTDGETAAVLGRVRKTPVVRRTRSMPVTVTTIGTDEAELELVWFRMPYIKSQLAPGNTYVFYGKVARKGSRRCSAEKNCLRNICPGRSAAATNSASTIMRSKRFIFRKIWTR